MVWDIFNVYEPKLYQNIWNWTLENYREQGKADNEVFGKISKMAIKQFFDRIYGLARIRSRPLLRWLMLRHWCS
jgi:fructose-bisphosphate aldolase class II